MASNAFVPEGIKNGSPIEGEKAIRLPSTYGWIQPLEQWNPSLPSSGFDTRRYMDLSNDSSVQVALSVVTSAVFWSNWDIVSRNRYENRYKTLDEQIIAFIKASFECLLNETFVNTMKALLNDAMIYGYCIAELIWLFQEVGKTGKSYHNITEIKVKPPFNFELWTDYRDELHHVTYNPGAYEEIDPNKFVIKPWPRLAWGNYYGRSILHSLGPAIKAKEYVLKQYATGLGLTLVKPIIHTYAQDKWGSDDIDKVLIAVRKLESASILEVPGKITNTDKGEEKFTALSHIQALPDRASTTSLQYANLLIDRLETYIYSQFGIPANLGLGGNQSGASLAKSQTEFDLFNSIVRQAQEWVESIINGQIIPRLLGTYNFVLPNGYIPPVFSFEEVEEKYKIDQATFYNMVIQSGIANAQEPWIRESLGFPPMEEEALVTDVKEEDKNSDKNITDDGVDDKSIQDPEKEGEL